MHRRLDKYVLALSCFFSSTSFSAADTFDFVDPETRVTVASLFFEGGADGRLMLFERWCSTDSRDCAAGGLPIPAGHERFFDPAIKQPVEIKVDNNIIIRLNPVAGIAAELENPEPIVQRPAKRVVDIVRNGEGLALPPAHMEASSVHEFTVPGLNISSMQILFPLRSDGLGGVIDLPSGWCGGDARTCPSFTVETHGNFLHQWVHGKTSESEPELLFTNDLELTLYRDGTDLAMEILQYGDNDTTRTQRFEGVVAAASSNATDSVIDCDSAAITLGGNTYALRRAVDNVCIGTISWATIPDARASLRLVDGWCGSNECGATDLESDQWQGEQFPTRFYEGQTNGPTISLTLNDDKLDQPAMLSAGDGRAIVNISTSDPILVDKRKPAAAYKIADLEHPLGIYSIVEGQTDLTGLGNRGDNLCLFSPTVFSANGRLIFKELGKPVNGNPYHVKQWMECVALEGDKQNCVVHQGNPSAPNPIGSTSGYNFSPIGGGDFKICRSGSKDCALLYACVGDDREVTYDRTFPATGENLTDAILQRWDGAPSVLKYTDNQTISVEQ